MTTLQTTPVPVSAAPAAARRRRRPGTGLWEASPLTYLALIIGIVLSIFPIVWSFIIASKDSSAVYEMPPVPGSQLLDNVSRMLANEDAAFLYGLANSFVVSAVVTISVLFTSTLAGFAFAKLRFRGREGLLLGIVLTMMVPTQLGIIPLYLMMVQLQWAGTLQAVIVPFMVQGFGVFMMRQYAASAISDELIEAARIDGCSTWRVYWNIVLPALRPAIGILGLLTFMQTWNEFLWPFVVLTPNTPTVQYSLKILSAGVYSQDYAVLFAGTALATLPLLLVFVLFGRQIIGGIMEGAVKS